MPRQSTSGLESLTWQLGFWNQLMSSSDQTMEMRRWSTVLTRHDEKNRGHASCRWLGNSTASAWTLKVCLMEPLAGLCYRLLLVSYLFGCPPYHLPSRDTFFGSVSHVALRGLSRSTMIPWFLFDNRRQIDVQLRPIVHAGR